MPVKAVDRALQRQHAELGILVLVFVEPSRVEIRDFERAVYRRISIQADGLAGNVGNLEPAGGRAEPHRRHVHQLGSRSPNVPGQPIGLNGNPPVNSAFGITNFNSAGLNENQYENTQFGVLALQRSVNGFDGQLSYFTRYKSLHFMPDQVGDLLINGIASDITRESYSNGIQGDASYVINDAHTLRTGFTISGEQSAVGNQSLVEPVDPMGNSIDAPFSSTETTDNVSKLGWLAGVYVQDDVEAHQQPQTRLWRALLRDVAIRRRQSDQSAGQPDL